MLSPFYSDMVEAGCDEAGRGPLAGSLFAAAVILPKDFFHPLLNDSKQISRKTRELLRPIIEKEALAWGVAVVDVEEIDRINILKASIMGMHRSLDKLSLSPEFIIIDGNKFIPYRNIPHKCFVKGDGRFASIAAASILAKTYRDDYMRKMSEIYPQYGWEHNMGYPTEEHRRAIAMYGATPLHRKSFQLLADPSLF